MRRNEDIIFVPQLPSTSYEYPATRGSVHPACHKVARSRALAAIVAWGAVSFAQVVIRKVDPGPGSISEQLSDIIRDGPGSVALSRGADLRGTLEYSHILVFRSPYSLRIGRPDELRIYDEDNGVLEERLRFRPSVELLKPQSLRRVNPGLQFDIERIVDIDGNGSREIIGAFSLRAMGPYEPRPVVIKWEPGREEYSIIPVLNAASF